MDKQKNCMVCGKALNSRQLKYCSKRCMGLGKQGYKICPVCGQPFPEWERSSKICCSPECSRKHRGDLHKNGAYEESIEKMRRRFSEKVSEIGPENLWTAKGWVIQSPDGTIYKCRNLLNFIREHPDLFDGTPNQAFDGFQKIKATMRGKRKNPSKSWKGWTLISWSES